jgi:large subunit ribosomal protein L4
MEITLHQLTDNDSAGVINVADTLLGTEFKPALIHQVVTAYLAGGRAGTRAQKNRSQVRGGGSKPWRQKGTGRARSGTNRSPLWRGGGVTFAASPQDFSQKVNRKMYRGAMRSILSELLRQDRLLLVDSFDVNTHKTKELVAKIKQFQEHKLLIVTDKPSENLLLAARNLYKVKVCAAMGVDPVSLVDARKVIMTTAAMKQIEEMWT